MRTPSRLPERLSGTAFTVAEASDAGVNRARNRAGDLIAPFRGIRMPAAHVSRTLELCQAYARGSLDSRFFSHVTAVQLHGLPLPDRMRDRGSLHVTVIAPRTTPRVRGIAGHRATEPPLRLSLIQGVRVSHPVDAWVQSAALLAVSELVVLGDALVRRRSPLATVAELHSAIVSGGRGVIRLRQAVKLIRPGVDSPRETLLRLLLGRAHLPEPEVNGLIVDGNGHFLALGDLVYREWRVVVEYDGEHHFASAEQVRHDLDRAERLVDAGWRVLRFNRMHMSDPVGIAHKVRHVLAVRQ